MFINNRKREHLEIVKHKDTSSKTSAGFEYVFFVPSSLPELSLDQIDTSVNFLGKKLSAPILISSMTGGTEEASKINAILSRAAEKHNIGFAVGSQKAMILHPELTSSYETRKYAPTTLIIGNIGIDYLLSNKYSITDLKNALTKIKANALYIHINPLQELVQPEGSKSFIGAKEKIAEVCDKLGMPVLVKEVGDGLNPKLANYFEQIGVSAIDVAGNGGTSWAAVEGFRGAFLGESFRNWGLPTVVSLISTKKYTTLPLVSSGGICSGQDIAKSIALGADLCGLAKPFLMAAQKSEKQLDHLIEDLIQELKINMFLVGAKNIAELKKSKIIIRSELKEIVEQL